MLPIYFIEYELTWYQSKANLTTTSWPSTNRKAHPHPSLSHTDFLSRSRTFSDYAVQIYSGKGQVRIPEPSHNNWLAAATWKQYGLATSLAHHEGEIFSLLPI
jgi:hypothetical protein